MVGHTVKQILRVSWLIWGDERGGVASAIRSHVELLARNGQTVFLLSFGPGALAAELSQAGYAVHLLGEPLKTHQRYAAYGFSPLGVLRRGAVALRLRQVLRRALRAVSPPQVLILPWADLIPLAGPVAKELRLALVMEMPSAPSRYRFDLNQRLYAWMVRRWRVLILANSDYTAAGLSRVPGVKVMTPAIDPARFDPGRVRPVSRAELKLPLGVPVMGLIARLDPAKGADLAIAALDQLGKEQPDLYLLLIGGPLDSAWAQTLRADAEARGVAARVRWVGPVSDPERYWGVCDLALNAYKGAEAFGLSLVEAMLMERPVVAHARGQPGNSVMEGQTGWLFETPEVQALVAALRRAFAVRSHWPRIGSAARQEALRRFASPGHGARYLALLRAHAEGGV